MEMGRAKEMMHQIWHVRTKSKVLVPLSSWGHSARAYVVCTVRFMYVGSIYICRLTRGGSGASLGRTLLGMVGFVLAPRDTT